jgi:hypothetical protein
MAPELFEGASPFIERAECCGLRAVKHIPAIAAYGHKADVLEHAQMLGNGGLFEAESRDDIADWALLEG